MIHMCYIGGSHEAGRIGGAVTATHSIRTGDDLRYVVLLSKGRLIIAVIWHSGTDINVGMSGAHIERQCMHKIVARHPVSAKFMQ